MTTNRIRSSRGRKVQSMNKLCLACLASLLVVAAQAQSTALLRSRNAVGLARVDIAGSNQLTLLAVPFTPVNATRAYTLDEVLGTNLHAGATAAAADEVFIWDNAQRTYHAAFLGDASLGWKWTYTGADNTGAVSNVGTITIVVNRPTATPETATTTENTPVVINIATNDSDPDGNQFLVLTSISIEPVMV